MWFLKKIPIFKLLIYGCLSRSNCEMDESQDLQLDFKNHLQRPEPTALTQLQEEIKQVKGNRTCWLSKNQAAQKEMLVEVLIHKEPSFEPRS